MKNQSITLIINNRVSLRNFVLPGIFYAIMVIMGCGGDSEMSQARLNTLVNKDQNYLEKTQFPFEILSVEPHIGASVKANGKVILSYELDMINAYRNTIFVTNIEVIDFDSEEIIASYDSTYLKQHLLRPGIQSVDEVLRLKTSSFGVANIWLELSEEDVPEHIYHKVSCRLKDRQGVIQDATMQVALVDFPDQTNLKIGPPIRKGIWFYIANAHRDVRLLTEGQPTYPQRYAIDLASITDQYKFELDSVKTIQSFKTYEEEILAVSDGKVVAVKDGIPENDPFADNLAISITRETVGGNFVVLDIGNGIHAFYAHFTPGSRTVEVGDLVRKGDVIGKLGNSGNSNGPHLHFHLETESKYPLGGEGVPYVFERFHQLALFEDIEIDSLLSFSNESLPVNETMILRNNQMPIGNGIIEFP